MDDNKKQMKLKHAIMLLLMLIGVMGMVLSCSPKIIEHVVYQKDTTYVAKIDSIYKYEKDSVFVKERGDTVYKYVEKVRYRDRYKVDTLIKVKVDSVAVETIKEVKVSEPLSWWKSFKIKAFWWLLGSVIALLIWIFRKPLLKLLAL